MRPKVIIVSGYFNPLHKGHIELFHKAKEIANLLFIILNNDIQRMLKGSKKFMNQDERLIILNELSITDKIILSEDNDLTVCKTLELLYKKYGGDYELYFANGGDQNNDSIPESKACKKLGIKLIDGLGSKIQSSSWILK